MFLDRDDVEPTNNGSERDLRPAVIHRKVIGGYRSDWGAEASAMFTSLLTTARKRGGNLLDAFRRGSLTSSSRQRPCVRSCPPGAITGARRPLPEQASAEPPAGRRRALVLVVALFVLSLVVVIGVGPAIIL